MMQTCVVNLTRLNPKVNGGVSRVARQVSLLLVQSAQSEPNLRVIFAVSECFVSELQKWLGVQSLSPCIIVPFSARTPVQAWVEQTKPDVVVSPLFGMEPFHQLPESIQHIVHMPDTLALDRTDEFARFDPERKLVYERLRQATHIITISNYSANSLIKHLQLSPTAVSVIPLGANAFGETPGQLPKRLAQRTYVLYPANLWQHKRHELLFEIMQVIWRTRPEITLVLTGGRDTGSGISLGDLTRRYQCPPDRVIDLGYVTDATLKALYQHAEAMLFVSDYEGFGMPILEAMANACPVICAPVTAIAETGGDAALYVESDDPNTWARAFLERLPLQRHGLVERGLARSAAYTWEKTIQGWKRVLEQVGLRLSTGNPRVAYKERNTRSFALTPKSLWRLLRCNETLRSIFRAALNIKRRGVAYD